MANVTDYGISTSNTGDENRAALLSLFNLKVGELYWPKGVYQLAPINKESVDGAETRYQNMRGDGIKNTVIQLAAGYTEGLFDWDKLYQFDTSYTGIQFNGRDVAPFLFKLTDGSKHYRISFRDCWFRNCLGDGLVIENGQYFILDGVTATKCLGTGIIIKGTYGVDGYVDVEQCGTGLLVDKIMEPHEHTNLTVSLKVYCETNGGGVRIKECKRVNLEVRGSLTTLDGASNCRVDGESYFENGANNNYIVNAVNDDHGPDRRLNSNGFGYPMEVATGYFDSANPILLERPGNYSHAIAQNLTAGNHKLTFVSEAIAQGKGHIQVKIQRKVGTWGYYNWTTRTYAASTNLKVPVLPGQKRFEVPFLADVDERYTVKIETPSNDPNLKANLFDVQVIDD